MAKLTAKHKPYPAYRPSGVEWLGDVPTHWEVQRIKWVAELNPSGSVERACLAADTPVTFLPMERVGTEGQMDVREKVGASQVWNGYKYFRRGDILVAKITPCFENGKGAYLDSLPTEVGFGSTEFHVLRAKPSVTPQFLYRLTTDCAFRQNGTESMIGAAGQQRVPTHFVANYQIPLPPLAEQWEVAAFLDCETAKIDALVSKKERLIELLQEKRTALISRAVTKGLDPDTSMKDSGIEWLGDVPAHWEVRRLKVSVSDYAGGVWGSEPDGVDDLPCVRVADFDRNRLCVHMNSPTLRSIKPNDRHRRVLSSGDLLLEKSGGGDLQPVGVVMLYDHQVPAVCSNFIARLRIAPEYDPVFLAYLHSTLYVKKLNARAIKQTTGIQNLDISAYLGESVCFPPFAEQIAIATFLDQETAKLDNLVAKVHEAIELLWEKRTALISAAVTGQIDVREEAGCI